MRRLEFSPYYPPRARWYGPLVRLVEGLRRIAWLDRIHLPEGITVTAFFSALFIPGLAFRQRRERLVGNAVMAAYILSALVFIIWLGFVAGNVAFGLMLALHATSILCLVAPWLSQARQVFRLLAGVTVLLTLGGLLYMPIRNQIQERWLMPLRVRNHVVIVQTFTPPGSVRRGDWVAYHISGDGGRGLVVQSGLALQRVQGLPGDRIRFTSQAIEVNGVPGRRLSGMPLSGELIVPENHWFIWPDHAMTVRGNPTPAFEAVLFGLADVDQRHFVGKPFQRWFWRRQTMQ
jgi:hypothetical protein